MDPPAIRLGPGEPPAIGVGFKEDNGHQALVRSAEDDHRTLLFTRRRSSKPSVVLIGASTGGPQALSTLLSGLNPQSTDIPICVALHMPRDFAPRLAEQVARVSRFDTLVIDQATRLKKRVVYLAPGDKVLQFQRGNGGIDVSPQNSMPQDQCRSSVDALFRSAAHIFGSGTLAIVLSGMGLDGLAGAQAVAAAGGAVLVQDRLTSAVWGMPGAVAKAGLASAVLPPEALAFEVSRRLAEPEAFRA